MILDDLVYLENLYRRVVVRPDDPEAAKLTDHYNFQKIRNGVLHTGAATPPAGWWILIKLFSVWELAVSQAFHKVLGLFNVVWDAIIAY